MPHGRARPRLALLDALRLIAAFQMIQGHTIDALLAPEFRSGPWHELWVQLRGLTSVAFLVAAGFAFQLATLRRLERHRRDRAAVARRYRRAALLVLLGYALHLPWFALFAPHGSAGPSAFSDALIVDVLQCIGVGLLVLETLALALPGRLAVELACLALSALVLAASPALSALEPHGPWLPLLQYLSPRGGSLFPLFPWVAHMLLAAGLGGLLLEARTPASRALRLLAAALFALALAAWLGEAGALSDHVRRLGWVLAFCAVLAPAEPLAPRWPAWARRLAGETLFLYVFHVVLVYGDGAGLGSLLGRRLSPGPAMLGAALVLLLSAAFALSYPRRVGGLARSAATG